MIKNYPVLKKLVPLFFFLCSFTAFSQSQIFYTSGTFIVPAGVTEITVEAWGGGGGGGSVGQGYLGGAGGGGGGAYASSLITVSPGSYNVVVGLGGASNIDGTNSTFNTSSVIALGGLAGNGNTSSAGAGGSGANSTGTIKYSGGNGANGYNVYTTVIDYNSGGGGGGAGSAGNGGNALGITAGTGTAPNGGNGGAGIKIHGSGNSGNIYGGGGGGAVRTTANNQNGGSGAPGLVVISWRTITTGTISPTSYCAGANVSIPYTITGTYNLGNIFTAQLSDAVGNFGTPVNIGTLTSTAAGTISGTIPVGTAAGTGYRIRVVSSNPSVIGTNNGSNLTINPLPTVNIGPAMTAICQGSTSAVLGGSVGGGATGGTWTSSAGGTFSPNATTLNATWTPPAAYSGTATLTLTTSGGSCGTTSASKTILVNPLPTVNIGPAMSAICQGSTSAVLGGSVGGGATGGTWTSSAGGTFALNATTLNATWTPPAAYSGTATLTLTTSGGFCGTTFASKTIVVNPLPAAAGAITGTPTVCQGQNTVVYSVPVITNATSYTWAYSGTGAIISGSTASMTINFAANATSGNLTVSGTNACGNGTVSANYAITVNILPTAPTTTDAYICTGSSATLAASGAITGQTYNWYTVASGGSSVNSTNSYNTPALSATTEYWVAIVNSNGCESVRTMATAFVNVKNIWTGNAYDKNWNTAGNWCLGVPTTTIGFEKTLNVLIPKGVVMPLPDGFTTPNYPIIAAEGTRGVANNIEIQEFASVTIEGVITDILKGTGTGNYLTIAGNLILHGIIDLNGESQLIQGKDSDLSGSGTIEIDQQGTGNSFWYNYWSSPVTPVNSTATYTIEEVLSNGDGIGTTIGIGNITFGAPYAFADVARDGTEKIKLSTYWMRALRDNKGYSAWELVGETGPIYVGEGFSMKGSNTTDNLQNYTFVGKPNNGNINLPLTGSNHYLVGNPYPSAIDVDKFLNDNTPTETEPGSITGAVYFWEHYGGTNHYLSDYIGGYASRNRLGQAAAASAFPDASGIRKIPGPYIPVGQGFFVVGNGDGGHIKFKNSQRVFGKESLGDAVFLKTSNTKSKTANIEGEDLRPKFRIGFDAPKISHRQLLFGIDERATPGVDWGFDAKIYQVIADDMYWMLNGNKYVIQATNETGLNSEVPLGIQLSKTGVATVKIDALENVDDDTSIYLKDKLTGETFNMRDKPVQLNLTAGKYEDRFVIVFKTQKLVAEDVKAEVLIPATSQPIIEGIHVFMNNALGELQIKNNSTEEITSVALVNTLGQTVKTWNSNFNIRTISLPISTATGVYLVQITTKTGKTVKKISVNAP